MKKSFQINIASASPPQELGRPRPVLKNFSLFIFYFIKDRRRPRPAPCSRSGRISFGTCPERAKQRNAENAAIACDFLICYKNRPWPVNNVKLNFLFLLSLQAVNIFNPVVMWPWPASGCFAI